MSGIEADAKQIVGPMMLGHAVLLDPPAQRAVANWAVLKGLVAVQTSKPEQIPENHYNDVYRAKGAPAETAHVWLGRRDNLGNPLSGKATLFASHFMPLTNIPRRFPRDPALNAYINRGGKLNATSFQVGHFFALVLQHDWPGLQVQPIPRSRAEQCFVSVWPTHATTRWPPPQPIDHLGDQHTITQYFLMKGPSGNA